MLWFKKPSKMQRVQHKQWKGKTTDTAPKVLMSDHQIFERGIPEPEFKMFIKMTSKVKVLHVTDTSYLVVKLFLNSSPNFEEFPRTKQTCFSQVQTKVQFGLRKYITKVFLATSTAAPPPPPPPTHKK